VVVWCTAAEGAWGSVLTFFAVLFSGLLTMNFFEPIAALIESSGGSYVAPYADLIAFVGLFSLLTFLVRGATDQISPTDIDMDGRAYQATRWIFAVATGYVTMAILATAIHTAPLPRDFIGFRPEKRNLLDMAAPDREWLGFTQRVSERILSTGRIFDGPVWDVPGAIPARTDVWPSFAIRYATRRQDLASGNVHTLGSGGALPGGAGEPTGPPAKGTRPAF
jgi:hypothetical protein